MNTTNKQIYQAVAALLSQIVLPQGETADNFIFTAQEGEEIIMCAGGSEAGFSSSLVELGNKKFVFANAVKSASVLLVDPVDPLMASQLNIMLEKTKKAGGECQCEACKARRKNEKKPDFNVN